MLTAEYSCCNDSWIIFCSHSHSNRHNSFSCFESQILENTFETFMGDAPKHWQTHFLHVFFSFSAFFYFLFFLFVTEKDVKR